MGYRILVVDDEVTLVNTVRAYLEKEGYTVRTAQAIAGTLTSPAAVLGQGISEFVVIGNGLRRLRT